MSSAEEQLHVSTVTGDTTATIEQVRRPLSELEINESARTNTTNNSQNRNESSGRRRRVSISEQDSGGGSSRRRRRSMQVNREFLVHRGRRKSYNTLVRPAESARAMSFRERTWSAIRTFFFCGRKRHRESQQYRIPPADEFKFVPFLWFSKLTEGQAVDFCLWHYRAGYTWSILAFLLFYFILIFVYAFIIRGSTLTTFRRSGEQCLVAWDFDRDSAFLNNFNLAFELSWTTLSTVGFGAVSIPAEASCRIMRYILATEAFIGVLYIGFCGAIFYAKIARGLATAEVTFSSAICLQYGKELARRTSELSLSGVAHTSEPFSSQTMNGVTYESEDAGEKLSTFPFLEFRVINDRANRKEATIANANVTCMAISFRLLDRFSQRGRVSDVFGRAFNEVENMQHEEQARLAWTAAHDVPNVKRTYRKVSLQHPKHPHFGNGAWYLKHTLDHMSPFLRGSVRRKIEALGGWPTSWNKHEKIRECLNPNIYEIGVFFTGLSNQNLVDVFKVQTWKPEDIYIGWQFVSTSYLDRSKKDDGRLHWKVDRSLIHDITPQNHGGNEPLGSRCPEVNLPQFLGKRHQLSEED